MWSTQIIPRQERIKKRRDRAEREGVVLHNYCCFAKCKAPANWAVFCRHAEHIISQWRGSFHSSSSLYRTRPCSSQDFFHWYSTVMAKPQANIQTVQQFWAEARRLLSPHRWRGVSNGLFKHVDVSCKDDACSLRSNSVSGSGVTCQDTNWIQITISDTHRKDNTVQLLQKRQSLNGLVCILKSKMKKGCSVWHTWA